MNRNKKSSLKEKVRNVIVAGEASAVRESAEVLFENAGKEVLADGTKEAIRELAEKIAGKGLENTTRTTLLQSAKTAGKSTKRLVGTSGQTLVKTAGKQGAKEAAKATAKESAKQVFKGVGRAAGLGGAIDGAFGVGEGLCKWKKGQLTGGEACVHAVKEAGTGAAASAAGVAATAGLIILTGPVSAPLAVGVAIAASVGTKLGLTSLFG